MSDDRKDDGGNAFPIVETDPMCGTRIHSGMSLRDWFAGMAISGFCANVQWSGIPHDIVARAGFIMADAMIEARKQ